MIASIDGVAKLIGENFIVIQTPAGIGYEVFCLGSFVATIHPEDSVFLYCVQIIKEESQNIYGFESVEQVLWFKSLIKASGVGAKTALAILDNLGVEVTTISIQGGDYSTFASVSGIGKKTAERLVIELEKEPFKINTALQSLKFSPNTFLRQTAPLELPTKPASTKKTKQKDSAPPEKASDNLREIINEASLALQSLGYDKVAVFTKVSLLAKASATPSTQGLIKQFLFEATSKL